MKTTLRPVWLPGLARLVVVLFVTSTAVAAPPVAEQRAFEVVSPNGPRSDPYYWLRDDQRKAPDVLAYLAAENAYFAEHSAAYQPLSQTLQQEIVGRIQIQGTLGFVKPDNRKVFFDVFVPPHLLHESRNGDKVLVRINDFPEDSGRQPVGGSR